MQKSLIFIFSWSILFLSFLATESSQAMAQTSFKSRNSAFEKIDNITDKSEVEFVLDKTLRGHSAGVQNIRFSPDGKWIASASLDRTIIIWDVKTGILRHRLREHLGSVYEVTFNKKGNLLASASEDGTVCLWDARYGKLLGKYKNKPLSLSNGLILRSASFVAFSPNNKYLYFGGDNGYIMRVRIDIPNQVPMQVFSINSEKGLLSNTITGGTIASTENELIFSVDHYVYAISLQNHNLVRRFHNEKADINDVVIGANKNQITGWAFDGTLVTWDYFSAKKINVLTVSPKENYSAASYSKDGNWLATGANGTVAKIWNTETKQNIATLTEQKRIVRVCRFSPTENGTLATASYDGRVYIWKEKIEEQTPKIEYKQEQILASHDASQVEKVEDTNNQRTNGGCDTVFVDRIVEKIVEKPIYIEAKNDSENIAVELEQPKEIIREKIVYVRDTVYIRDTVFQKVFVEVESQIMAKNNSGEKEETTNLVTADTENDIETQVVNIEDEESEFDKQFVVGKTLNLHNIQFEQGTAKLLHEAYEDLEKLLGMLKKYPNMKIALGGHTDNVGVHTVNLRLSGERVRTVQNYLVSHGINRSRIQTRAYGGKFPIASNAQEETRKLNRRVEVTILSK
ncbi:OmpA family protein [Bernardetia sp.]|uniref:OmpA family protein n=1 Tax=Bernardetia sp. TaxID=1937974 RepID=UPI0025BE29E8|nr:OmpA family protein [Bernardetia sp.]